MINDETRMCVLNKTRERFVATNVAVADPAMGADPAMLARIRPKLVHTGGSGLAQ